MIVVLCVYVLQQGVKKGIERLNLILMPLLLIIFVGLLVYSMYQDSFLASCKFLFAPNFGKLTPQVIVDTIGQVFFPISRGWGDFDIFRIYTKRGEFYQICAPLLNFVFCLVAGLVIFSFIFGYGATPDGGLGLYLFRYHSFLPIWV